MKIRNILISIAAAAFSFTAVSCDAFLDMQPSSSANVEGAIEAPSDATAIIRGVMRKMTIPTTYGRNIFLYADAKGGGVVRVLDGHDLAILFDDALFRLIKAEQNRHQGRFSRAVFTEERMDLTLFEL